VLFHLWHHLTFSSANTRREEIARFNKAKTDKEFAKMLSTRALGPEHLESQQHLRRSIRVCFEANHCFLVIHFSTGYARSSPKAGVPPSTDEEKVVSSSFGPTIHQVRFGAMMFTLRSID
jgi:hypothetical protein